MRQLVLGFALWSLSLVVARAQGEVFVSLSNGDLYKINAGTCQATRVGNSGTPLYDIALAPDGTLFGLSSTGYLVEVNTTTAKISVIGSVNSVGVDCNSLVCDKDGTLYAAYFSNPNLYKINALTGEPTKIGSMGYNPAGDLTLYDNELYLAAENNRIIKVNKETGKGTLVGQVSVASGRIFGIVTGNTTNCDDPELLALSGQDILALTLPGLGVRSVCKNVVPATIFGATSLSENKIVKLSAGADTTVVLCKEQMVDLKKLLRHHSDDNGVFLKNKTPLASPLVSLTQLPEGRVQYEYAVAASKCRDTAVIVLDYTKANFSLGRDTVLCEGQVIRKEFGDPAARYRWANGLESNVLTISQPGIYAVTVTKGACVVRDTIQVQAGNSPTTILPADTAICMGKSLTMSVPTGFERVTWWDSTSARQRKVSQAGTYWVKVQTNCGVFKDEMVVAEYDCARMAGNCPVLIPDAFSPNTDGVNDSFEIKTSCGWLSYHVRIYDRWGELLFESTDPGVQWDGTYQQRPCAAGTYVVHVEAVMAANLTAFSQKMGVVLMR